MFEAVMATTRQMVFSPKILTHVSLCFSGSAWTHISVYMCLLFFFLGKRQSGASSMM